MARLLAAVAGLLLVAGAAHAASPGNQLRDHPSPYLAMHGADPVTWQDWNRAAVERARREGKLLFVSVGYFSCHWCHVMQRESYRNAEIAGYINRHFIPVKVDRELEAALDARLIDFAEKTRGQAGWPLNAFLTPDGHPLYVVLYQPPGEFLDGIRRLQALWEKEAATLRQLAQREAVTSEGPGEPRIDAARARGYAARAAGSALRLADWLHGGFGETSKFPSVPQLDFLLLLRQGGADGKLGEFLLLTLDEMARGGLHDHVGGGFFRYTVDADWRTPHFEKMLYDNALLARLYWRAARVFGRADYERVARTTLAFMARELRAPDGALIAALSAVDERNVEGGHYLWRLTELAEALPAAELSAYRLAFGMTEPPEFEAGWLPVRARTGSEVAEALGIEAGEVERRLARAGERLLATRAARRPPRDTKPLAGWNGLALAAFAEAAKEEGAYRGVARGVRDYLVSVLWDGRDLRRAVIGGRAVGAVSLEDYAYVALGLLEWARLTGDEADFREARAVVDAAWRKFHDSGGWRLVEASLIGAAPAQDLVNDGPMPSPAAVLAQVSIALADRMADTALRARALSALNTGHAVLAEDPFPHVTHIAAMLAAGGP